jgi:large subunit ribosomal protein L5e
VHATLAGDVVLCAAYAHELPRYGLTVGLTNYAAAYCAGLLVARRALAVLGLAETYVGAEEATGEDFTVEEAEGAPRPFAVLLDTGLKRTSTGSKVFAALKGALDGGLDIPHSDKRFVGYDPTDKALDTETLQKYVLGGHVGEFMEELQEEDPEQYQKQFSRFVQAGVGPEDLEELYRKVHAAIRADPAPQKKARSKPAAAPTKPWKAVKSTYEERKARLKAKLADMGAAV